MGKGRYVYFLIVVFVCSCVDTNSKISSENKGLLILNNKAKLFSVHENKSFHKIIIYGKNGDHIDEYFLFPDSVQIPDSLKTKQIIKIPVKSIVTLSTTHVAFFDVLEETDHIIGVSDFQYIYNAELIERINLGEVANVGYENALDFELLLSLKPDLVTVYDINGTISPVINKLKKFDIPVVQVNEYLESSPLAQAEWIKFFGELVNKKLESESYYRNISDSYSNLKKMTDSIKERPKVLLNMPWKGTWYLPGGTSNMAQLIKDAGGDYIWKDAEENHNIPLSIEDVYLKASAADIWLNPGQANSISDIASVDKRLMDFLPMKTLSIYNRNKRMSEKGGNDYMESGTLRPDLILEDLIYILHPDLLPVHKLYYYKKLE